MLKLSGLLKWNILFVFIYLSTCVAVQCDGSGRKLTVLQKQCPSDGTRINNVVYVKAEGANDTIHHIWSSMGSFAIFNALTSNTSIMSINCERLINNLSNAITFSEKPHQSLVVLLTKLYEYNDWNNSAQMPNTSDTKNITWYWFKDLEWENVTLTNETAENVEVIFNLSHLKNDSIGSDAIQLHLSAYGSQDRFEMLPRLIHTANSVQLDVIVDHAKLNYSSSRFAIEVMLIGQVEDGALKESSYASIDDEYTPGVFRIKQIQLETQASNHRGPYMQWKPTAYTKYPHIHESSTMAVESSLSDQIHFTNKNAPLLYGIAYGYYGSNLDEIFGQAINISFGMVDDEFYEKTDYLSWTFAVGYGTPPKDEMSAFIIIVISVGLGIPVVLLVSGSIFNAVRKRTKKDELLLSSEQ